MQSLIVRCSESRKVLVDGTPQGARHDVVLANSDDQHGRGNPSEQRDIVERKCQGECNAGGER